MFIIGEAVIDDSVAHSSFCCDLKQCKGACCCIEGGRGAPLGDDEALEIESAFPFVKQYLSEQSIRVIEATGLYEGTPGDYVTPCIEQRECVYVYFEDGIARCSFERAYEQGLIQWRKPISCHLFPIRIREFGQDFIRYEEIDECAPARARGKTERVSVFEFLQQPLVRKYGEEWYNTFKRHCDTMVGNIILD